MSRSNASDSVKGIECVDLSALSQAQIFILPNSPNIPPNQPNSAVGALVPNGFTLEGQIFVENSVFNLSIRVNSHRDVDGSNEHGVYFTAGNSGWTSSIKVENNQVSTQQTIQPPWVLNCLLYTSPSPRDGLLSRMPSSA